MTRRFLRCNNSCSLVVALDADDGEECFCPALLLLLVLWAFSLAAGVVVVVVALAFFLAGHIQLYFHLGLMLLMGGIGTFAYVIVDLKTMRMIHAQPNSCE